MKKKSAPPSNNKPQKQRNPILKRILLGLLILIILGVVGFVIWGSTPAQPDEIAMQALRSDTNVTVTEGKFWLEFTPANRTPQNGFIFYPGGRVDYRAYAPLLREIAAAGNTVFLVRMPLNLAVFGVNRADEILSTRQEIRSWYIGGHSLGGAMASSYLYNHSDQLEGLVLWAAYPAESNDLSKSGKSVLSIIANRDGLATLDKITATAALLPTDTIWVEIDGGNHAQFGSYGSQSGDLEATIPAEEQQRQIVTATIMFMAGMR
ncbi:MAG TPA: alpha/beta hydrolase [Anaerolineaceae bacterium]|nr:alpha/beta hydrolase [Anaerolineaceae bacterium]